MPFPPGCTTTQYRKMGPGTGNARVTNDKGQLRCSLGGEFKEPEEFPLSKHTPSGRDSSCKEHKNARSRKLYRQRGYIQ